MATSPTPGKKKTVAPATALMDFFSALRLVLDGKKISKKDWGSNDVYFYLKNEWLVINNAPGEYTFQIRDVDLKGEDYFVIK